MDEPLKLDIGMSNRSLVLLADEIDRAGVIRLCRRFDVATVAHDSPLATDNDLLRQADILVVRTFRVTAELLNRMPRLKLIAKHGAGVDNIDITAASARGVLVTNTPGANATAVAEGTIALILAVLRRIGEADRTVRTGNYARGRQLLTRDLFEGRLGLIGFGQIAQRVASIATNGFRMRVAAFDPYVDSGRMTDAHVTKAPTLEALLKDADIVSIHVPLTHTTQYFIGRKEIALMKSTSVLINTARGGIVDESALADALRAGRIAGAALDVFETEPPRQDNPLFALDNVLLSPHIAGVTAGSLRKMALQTAEMIENVFDGNPPSVLLNPDVWMRRRI